MTTTYDYPYPSEAVEADQIVLKVPAKRWFLYRARLDMATGEILEDTVAQLVVAAHELHLKQGGKEDIAGFLEFDFEELSRRLGVNVAGDAADPKSADEPGGGDQPVLAGDDASDVDAAGAGDRVPEGAGPVLPGDGSDAG